MALAEVLTINVGVSITKWITKAWLGDGLRAELAGGAYDVIGQRVPDFFAQRRLRRQLDQVAETSGEKLSDLIESEFRDLSDNEKVAAVLAVSASLEAGVGRLNLADLDFEPLRLIREIKSADPDRLQRAGLSGSGVQLYELILLESCTYIIEVATTLPNAASSAYIELLRRETAIIDMVKEIYERLPDPRATQLNSKSRQAEYEINYRRFMARKFDRLELFGLSVSELSGRYALSVAYITLSVKRGQSANPERDLENNSIDDSISSDQDYLRVDDAIGSRERIFVRGSAGCGKTTLLQWLAVKAAREEFEGALEEWNGLIPIFLPLRRFDPGKLPSPHDFLRYTSLSIAEGAPEGWLDEVLRQGRALVMIDGVDEVPESARPGVRKWLEDLMDRYEACRYVVTSRPAAVPESWLRSSAFEPMDLQSMTVSDIRAFVTHWHDAAGRDIQDADTLAELDDYKNALLRSVRTNRQIRSLATTPLLCAMLCALNRDRRTHLPRDRVELYRIALETLLERRDIERQIDHSAYPQLSLPQKIILLRELAYWLMLNDQSDTELAVAEARFEHRIGYIQGAPGSAAEVTRYLLVRSGLLREPIPGRVDFIHRTFQEYLAAIEVAELGNIPFLISKANEDQWREVVILASGHCSVRQKEQLLDGIIQRGNEEPENRHRLHLLAVACLETARELPPDLANRIAQCLYELLPPGNFTEAKDLSSAGDLALTLLNRYARERAQVAAACVRTAALVGGELATEVLTSFADDKRITVQKELIRAWSLAEDPEYFAKRVLVDTPFAAGKVVITDSNLLSSVQALRHVTHVRAYISGSPIETIPPVSTLRFLDVSDSPRLSNLENLRLNLALDGLNISSCARIRNLDFLAGLAKISWLSIQNCATLSNIDGIEDLAQLYYLNASNCSKVADWGPLRGLASLQELHLIRSSITDLSPLSNSAFLNTVRLERTQLSSIEPLAASTRAIESLDISICPQLQNIDLVARMEVLEYLSFSHADNATQLPDIGHLDKLTDLNVTDCANLTRIGSLPSSLTFLSLDNCTSLFVDEGIGELPNLETLYLDASPIRDLSFLESCSELSTITLFGSNKFASLRPFANFKNLSTLDLRRCHEDLNLRELGNDRTAPLSVFLDPNQAIRGEQEFLRQGNQVLRTGFYASF